MALNSITYTANQIPWVPPADMDQLQPFKLVLKGKPGAGETGGATLGGHGGGGAGYGEWDAITVSDLSAVEFDFVAGSTGYVKFIDTVGNQYIAYNGQDGVDGGARGPDSTSSDVPPDITSRGGNGGARGTTSGGGGGGNGTVDGIGVDGSDGGVATGGAGGLNGSGSSGGSAGGNVAAAGANGVSGGGGGGGTTHTGGLGLPIASAIVTYTIMAGCQADAGNGFGAGSSLAINDDATQVRLTGQVLPSDASHHWTTDGAGTFDDATSLTPIYTFGVGDGFVNMTLTATKSGLDPGADTIEVVRSLRSGGDGANAGPVCTTSAPTIIGATTATLSGEVVSQSDGGGVFVTRGIAFSQSHGPDPLTASHVASFGGIGAFTVNVTGLSAGTWYCATYAQDAFGTGIGNEVSFVVPTTNYPPADKTSLGFGGADITTLIPASTSGLIELVPAPAANKRLVITRITRSRSIAAVSPQFKFQSGSVDKSPNQLFMTQDTIFTEGVRNLWCEIGQNFAINITIPAAVVMNLLVSYEVHG